MTNRHDLTTTLPWMREGTALLLETADRLTDAELHTPSLLPGWTRAHVIGHVARNAEALVRLATWARTGIRTPMYADRGQRAAEIESSATLPPHVLREELKSTAADLEDALGALETGTWQAEVKSALGRTIPAAEIPWMRIREVWLHAVDLASGTAFTDLPHALIDILFDDATATLSTRPDCPAVSLTPTDRDRTWHIGPTATHSPAGPIASVEASAAELLGWLTGRVRKEETFSLPKWL
ncbi:maleylpyruvate isomerase family mycothiol-dependent enzyme [Streptomyces sp. NPDC093594]|uniref:maleylpyruvate isomerase family mycothiol-dependent enzyme n=1 Tax=Streptomyces sp. NPDC093594 TaxID=3155305 RepID=UPI00344C7241